MKKLSLFLAILMLSVMSFGNSVRIVNQGFDGDFPGEFWQVSGNPTWGKVALGPRSSSWAAWCAASSMDHTQNRYANNMAADLSFGPFGLTRADSASISFRTKVHSEAGRDSFTVVVRYKENNVWKAVQIHKQTGTGSNNDWKEYNYSLNQFKGKEEIKISFLFHSNATNNNFGGAWLDDVKIDLVLPNDETKSFRIQGGGSILEGGGSLSW